MMVAALLLLIAFTLGVLACIVVERTRGWWGK